MPVAINHVYNANDKANDDFGMGYGWRSNYNQLVYQWSTDSSYYVWEDEDATRHYFKYKSSGTYEDETNPTLTLTTTGSGTTKGVDADAVDAVTEANLDDGVQLVKTFAQRAGCIVTVTGAIDLVSDGERCWCIRNGRAEMSRITGTGCQLSALMTAFLVANPDHKLAAAAAAVCMMGLAGEIGWANMQPGDGNSTYRNRIIDAIFNMTGDALEKGAKYELR